MRHTRVHVDSPLEADSDLRLPEAAAIHVARVLRLREGATLIAFDGSGDEFRCEVLSVRGDAVVVRVGARTPGLAEPALRITLVQAVSRGERMDWTLQKATELGVHAIAPVLSARSVVRLDERQAGKKLRHWQAIVAAACEQCGRSVVPQVQPPRELSRFLAASARQEVRRRLVPIPDAPASLAAMSDPGGQVELLIGPEGGLEDGELESAAAAGFVPVRLGPRVLRTETAGVVALAVLQASWGDLA